MTQSETGRQSTAPDQDELVGLVYDAVLEPALWPQLLEHMGHYLNALPASGDDGMAVLDGQAHDALASHFRRAVKIQQKVSRLESLSQAFSGILNRLPIGVILVRQNAMAIARNQLASDVLDETGHMHFKQGKLQANSIAATRQLHALIRDSFLAQHKQPESMSIGPAGGETTVWVTCSSAIDSRLNAGEALAAVFVHSAKIQRQIPLAAFAEQYHLSRAESRLASVMLNGCHTLNEAAEHLGVSKNTVRSQIKAIFSKTGTGSQTELIKKILTSPSAMIYSPARSVGLSPVREHGRDRRNEPQAIHLHDGRRLEWREHGAPDGMPVMVFHSLTGAHPDYSIARAMNIRLIVPERPGAHGSDPLPGRSFLDWPDDVRQLADALDIKRFSLIGFSAGTPYALACASEIRERINGMALVSCMAPVRAEEDLEGMIPLNHTAMRLGHQSPELLAGFMDIFLKDLEQDSSSYFNAVAKHQPDHDHAVLERQEIMDHFLLAFQQAAKENFQQLCDEIILCAADWPLDLSRYSGHVSMWHGQEDPLVPIRMGRRIADELKNPDIHFLANEGNYLVYSHWREILSALVQQAW
jgi:pimeloyl-ACP methyl ester carboxylesterase/DNA-binding NarL/FixJ family response regulator